MKINTLKFFCGTYGGEFWSTVDGYLADAGEKDISLFGIVSIADVDEHYTTYTKTCHETSFLWMKKKVEDYVNHNHKATFSKISMADGSKILVSIKDGERLKNKIRLMENAIGGPNESTSQ